jgi:hypothetical protein
MEDCPACTPHVYASSPPEANRFQYNPRCAGRVRDPVFARSFRQTVLDSERLFTQVT